MLKDIWKLRGQIELSVDAGRPVIGGWFGSILLMPSTQDIAEKYNLGSFGSFDFSRFDDL